MEVDYKIIKDYGLLVQRYKGVFNFDEFVSYSKKVMADPEWEYVDKIITDIRGADVTQFYEKMDNLLKYRKEVIRKSFVNVLIVNNPLSTVTAFLYKDRLSNYSYRYEYCSTVEYALELLKLEDKFEEISAVLNSL